MLISEYIAMLEAKRQYCEKAHGVKDPQIFHTESGAEMALHVGIDYMNGPHEQPKPCIEVKLEYA